MHRLCFAPVMVFGCLIGKSRAMLRFAIAFSLVLLALTAASAEPEPLDASPSAPAPPARPDLQVTGLTLPAKSAETPSEKKKEAARQFGRAARLGDSIVLKTSPGLASYLDYAVEHDKAVTLFLDGNDTGIGPEGLDRESDTLQFRLERNGDNKGVWSGLLRAPFQNQTRTVKASVGFAGGVAVPAAKSEFTLVVAKLTRYAIFWLIWMVALLVIFGWYAIKTDLLRDGPKCSYSLGRCQMAWWFLLILFGYVMIWLISGDQDSITPSLLALMGISAGTALGSVLIDSSDPRAVPAKSRGFRRDILSDSEGTIALHRFQIVVWTIVLGIVFMVRVVIDLSMPAFSPTLLGLMGISGSTYIGFKFSEK